MSHLLTTFDIVKSITKALKAALPDAKVYILGSNPSEEIKALETERLRIIGFVTDEELEPKGYIPYRSVTVTCPEGSYAHRYCMEKGIPVVFRGT